MKLKKSYLLAFLALGILPYLYLSFFAQPIADDFSFAIRYQKEGVLDSMYKAYINRTGRYVSNLLVLLNPISFGSFSAYRFIPIVLILTTILSFKFLAKSLLLKKNNQNAWIFSLLFTHLLFALFPTLAQQIYWFTGGVIYHLGLLITAIYVGLLVNYLRNKIVLNKWFHQSLLFVLLFALAGFTEVLTLVALLLLGSVVVVFYKAKLTHRLFMLKQLIALMLFAVLLIFAPANEIRSDQYLNNHNLTYSLAYSLAQVVRFLGKWMLSPAMLVGSVLFVAFYERYFKDLFIVKQFDYLNKWFVLLLLLFVVFSCIFPAYWSTGMLGQHRTLNVALFFFIPLWFFNLAVWTSQNKPHPNRFKFVFKYQQAIRVVFILSLLFYGNNSLVLKDLISGAAYSYSNQLNMRHKQLIDAKESKLNTIVLKPIDSKPLSLYVLDISTNSSYWTNQCYNGYFGLADAKVFVGEQSPKD